MTNNELRNSKFFVRYSLFFATLVPRDVYFVHRAGGEENYSFTNIGHTVGDTLEVMSGPDKISCAGDDSRIFYHIRQKHTIDLLVKQIDLVILGADCLSGFGVSF